MGGEGGKQSAPVPGRGPAQHGVAPAIAPGKRTLTSAALDHGVATSVPPAPDGVPAADTKRSVRFEFLEWKAPGGIRVRVRGELSVKNEGSLNTTVGGQHVSVGTAETILAREKGQMQLQLASALAKNTATLLDGDAFGPPLDAFSLKLETKAFEASLSIRDDGSPFDLKLLTVTMIAQGDLAVLLQEPLRSHVEARATIRGEWALSPELARKMVVLARATHDARRASAVGEKLSRAKQQLAAIRKVPNNLYATLNAQNEVGRLKKLKRRYGKLARSSSKALAKVVGEIDKLPGGKLVKVLGKKVISKALKKFIPIYNVISTAQDLVDVASFLSNVDWEGVGDKIMNGGEGGTQLGDGSARDGDADADGGGPAGDEGTGGDGDTPAKTDDEREIDERENGISHPASRAVLDGIMSSGGSGVQLSKEDKETIDFVVPLDLTSQEIAQITGRLGQPGTQQMDTVDAVIAALHEIRPGGEKPRMLGPDPLLGPKAPQQDAKPQRRETTIIRKAKKAADRKAAVKTVPRSPIVDPIPVFLKLLRVGPDGRVSLPRNLVFNGIEVEVGSVVAGFYLTQSNDQTYVKVGFLVSRSWPGARLADGRLLVQGQRLHVEFPKPTAKTPQT